MGVLSRDVWLARGVLGPSGRGNTFRSSVVSGRVDFTLFYIYILCLDALGNEHKTSGSLAVLLVWYNIGLLLELGGNCNWRGWDESLPSAQYDIASARRKQG